MCRSQRLQAPWWRCQTANTTLDVLVSTSPGTLVAILKQQTLHNLQQQSSMVGLLGLLGAREAPF